MSDLPYDDEFDDEYRDLEFDPDTGEYRPSLLSGGDGTDSLPGAAGGQTQTQAPSPMAPRVSAGGRAEAMLRQLMETGAQGRTMPSNAADLAMAQTRVASILSKALKGMDGTSGLERVGSAALQTLAGQGRVSFPQAMAAMEQQDLGRAYNIANALSGLAKAQGAGAMTPQQMLNYVQRVQESEDRNIRTFDSQLSNEIGAIARGAANPSAVIAAFRNGLTNAGYDRAQTVEQKREIANRVLQSVANQPFAQPRPRRGEGGERGDGDQNIGGPIAAADGGMEFREYKKIKGGPWAAWMVSYNEAVRTGRVDEAEAIWRSNTRANLLKPEERKPFESFLNSHQAAKSASDLINMAIPIIDRTPSALATAGRVQSFVDSAAQQIGNLLSNVSQNESLSDEARVQARNALKGLATATGREELYGANLNAIMSRIGAAGEDAARLRSIFTSLAYAMAQANDPGGRFSNQDVNAALAQIAGSIGSPGQVKAVLEDRLRIMAQQMESRRQFTPYFNQLQTPWTPDLNVNDIRRRVLREPQLPGMAPAPAAQVPAPVPAPAPTPAPAPAPALAPTPAPEINPAHVRALQDVFSGARQLPPGKTRDSIKADFDKKYGQGAADRILGASR